MPGRLELAILARSVSGSGVGRDAGVCPEALAQGAVSQIRAVAARSTTRSSPTRGPAPRPEPRSVSRPSARYRSLWRRLMGAPFLLRFRIPGRLTPGRLLTQGPGLGLPAA